MKTVVSWGDMAAFGIIPLTGEACGLVYRILFDVTDRGRKILGTCFGIPNINLPEPWNRGSAEDPHVGCIMLTQEALVPLAVFALLEGGCQEVYLMGCVVVGFEADDPPDAPETMRRVYGVEYTRRFGYWGSSVTHYPLIPAVSGLRDDHPSRPSPLWPSRRGHPERTGRRSRLHRPAS